MYYALLPVQYLCRLYLDLNTCFISAENKYGVIDLLSMTAFSFDLYFSTSDVPHMPSTFVCVPPAPEVAEPRICETPILPSMESTRCQAMCAGRALWNPIMDLFLPNGIGLRHRISTFHQANE